MERWCARHHNGDTQFVIVKITVYAWHCLNHHTCYAVLVSEIPFWVCCSGFWNPLSGLMCLQVESTIEYICRNEGEGAILVFLTGWDEISKLLDKIKANNFLGDSRKFLLLPLHGSMPTVNQREIFDRPPSSMRQVFPFWSVKFTLKLTIVLSSVF